jgi:hypothetical protein
MSPKALDSPRLGEDGMAVLAAHRSRTRGLDDRPLILQVPNHTHDRQQAEFFKLILCENPVDLMYIVQESPFTPSWHSSESSLHVVKQSTTPLVIPGVWNTTLATLSVTSPSTSDSPSRWGRLHDRFISNVTKAACLKNVREFLDSRGFFISKT